MKTPINHPNTQRIISLILISSFFITSLPIPLGYTQQQGLPKPGVRVGLSPSIVPACIKAITVHPDNPLQFDFIIDQGETAISVAEKQQEYKKLIKYFLASLTIPEKNLWVNLSPYEKDRVIPQDFGMTEMGREVLAQDYLLKQITASLI